MQNNQVQEMQTRKKRKGFTLAELVVVVAILAVLAVILVPRIAIMTEQARIQAFESNYSVLQTAMHAYMNANNSKVPDNTTLNELKDYIADEVPTNTDVVDYFTNKPKGSKYEYSSGVLTCTLSDVNVNAIPQDGVDANQKPIYNAKGEVKPDPADTSKNIYVLTFTPIAPTT